ncbi:MAG: histidine kinase [Candidatus Eremiobacteraeota bacterium]|nr:histidine kinase [Candidatus Eremiobacteraeota bacterium]
MPIKTALLQNVIEFFCKFSFFIILFYIVARYTAFSQLLYRKELKRKEELLLAAVFGIISIAFFIVINEAGAPLFLPLFFGMYSGMVVGAGASVILAVYTFIIGQPLYTIGLCLLAGPLGALMGMRIPPGGKKPFYVPLIAGFITLLGFSTSDTPFYSMPTIISTIPDLMFTSQTWYFSLVLYLAVYAAGCYLLLAFLELIIAEEDRKSALQTDNILRLVGKALDQIREGISQESARKLCENLRKALDIPGVCIIKKHESTYFPGRSPHEYPQDSDTFRNIQKRIFEEGLVFEGNHTLIFGKCPRDCDFTSIFLLPLSDGQKVVAALGFIQSRRQAFSHSEQNLVTGLSLIFSSELTRSKLEEQRMALESAKFKLLQAQINPHFLFNSLNTIAWMTGKDPQKAEELIIHLSTFMRQSFDQKGEFVTLRKEIEYLKSYLFIEKARFMEKLQVHYAIDDQVLSHSIPPFLIQPLVENSIKHGLSKKKEGGTIHVTIQPEEEKIKVEVSDNGVGCSPERLHEILHTPPPQDDSGPRRGIGVFNVKERVVALFGPESKFEMESTQGEGTKVRFYIVEKGEKQCQQN